MTVWTIQPVSALEQLDEEGVFRCDPQKSYNLSKPDSLKPAYQWLMERMKEKIGGPPQGVTYPVWAWHTWNFKRECPDPDSSAFLTRDTEKVLFTLDIPEHELVLSDYDAWQSVMLDSYVADGATEEDFIRLEEWLEGLSDERMQEEIQHSWDNVFLIDTINNEFLVRGRYVQATFWELRKDLSGKQRFFRPIHDRIYEAGSNETYYHKKEGGVF